MQAVLRRRSIRRYTEQKVSDELIEQILRAGMAAPSAGNERPWHFIVIDDREILNGITGIHPYSKMLKEASHAIVVCCDHSLEKYRGSYWVQDCSASMENMLIMAEELGLGSVWLGVYPLEERVKPLKEFLGLPENVTPFSIMSLGYPAEEKAPQDRFDPARIHYNKW